MIKNIEETIKIRDYKKAKELIDIELGKNIFNEKMYFYLGSIYENKGEYNRAYLCYEHALSINSNSEYKELIEIKKEKIISENNISVKNTSIIILAYNNLQYTKICLDSIKKYNSLDNCEIIIVDNDSTDGTQEWLKEQDDIKIILNDKNEGFPKGCNQGIEIAEKENDIFLLNNDTVVMPNSIFNLRMALYSDEKVGATGAVSNKVSNYQQISEVYDDFDGYMDYALKNNMSNEERYERKIKLVGFAMLMKREVLNKVGYLDERFTPGNYEDDDISFRILNAGYELLLCRDSYIHHFGSVSFNIDKEAYRRILSGNAKKFEEKWGFNAGYSCNIRFELINFMEHKKDEKINVLEIGCASGATLLEIKNRYPNSSIYGIELNEFSAKIAKNFADIVVADIENLEMNYEENFFDYIIMGDVLEHLVNPKDLLEKLKGYLKNEGSILISLPNVMHYSVVYGLINGCWKYEESGILDKTHLRFFTHREICNMCDEAKYYIKETQGIYSERTAESEEFVKKMMELSCISAPNQYYIVQYLLKIHKNEFIKNVSYILRRLEFEVGVKESASELLDLIGRGVLDETIIIDTVNKNSVDKIKVLNLVANLCLEQEYIDMIIPLLNAALTIDKEDVDTNCNMSHILSLVGEKELALMYLDNIKVKNERVIKMREYIGGYND